MNERKFLEKRDKWLKEVANGCHDLAIEYPENPDFYVFQSDCKIENPDLLIIGANPGKYVKYLDKMREKGLIRRYEDNLGYDTNQYIENENNPEWKINKPILKMFTEANARKALENSVIMNVVYFNTRKVDDLKRFENGKKMIEFSIEKTKELIYKILKPKNILFLGVDAPKWMKINFIKENDTVLKTDDNLFLIQSKLINGINHFLIYHPSMNQKFNTGKNLELKKNYFNKYFENADASS